MTYFRSHYNLNLLSISVGAKTLEIDPSLFQLGGGSFIDSGTTNVYLHESIYGYFHLVVSLSSIDSVLLLGIGFLVC